MNFPSDTAIIVVACLRVQFLKHMLAANFDFALVLAGSCEIVGKLHSKPGFRRAAKGLREANRHLGADARLAVNDVVERLPADAENFRSLGYGQTQRLKAIMPHDATRMYRILHGHCVFSFSLSV